MIAPPAGPRARLSIAGISRPLIVIAVAQPRIGAALESLLRADDRFDIERAADGADIPPHAALAIVDAGLLQRMPAPLLVPSVVILDGSADRVALGPRAPAAREWLRTASTGDELLAAIDRALKTPAVVATPPATPTDAATPTSVPAAAQPAPAQPAVPQPGSALDVALILFGAACGAISLVMLWMALRP